jgi:hypothetical protein
MPTPVCDARASPAPRATVLTSTRVVSMSDGRMLHLASSNATIIFPDDFKIILHAMFHIFHGTSHGQTYSCNNRVPPCPDRRGFSGPCRLARSSR